MAESPDDIPRALADPERLAVAGRLARSDAASAELADALDFRDGRLTEVAAKESKRRIVLGRIALEFEPGVDDDEATVNAIVGRVDV